MSRGARAWAVVAMLCACSPSRDVPLPDAENGPRCGDGNPDIALHEDCDLGPDNGLPTSQCSMQCTSAVTLGIPPPCTKYVEFGAQLLSAIPLDAHWVATLGVDGAMNVFGENETGPDNPKQWRVSANAVALGRFRPWGTAPVWIEMAPGPHLYAVDRSAAVQSPIELPYPFPDGINPEIIEPTQDDEGIIVVDENGAGDLLVAVIVPSLTSHDIATYKLRASAPPGTRGITIDSGYQRAHTFGNGVRNLVVFYDNPGSFVGINIHYDRFPAANDASGPMSIAEATRGTWPYRVVSGDFFDKPCPQEPYWPFTNPSPIAMVTDDGTIYVWQFDHSPPGSEAFLKPFAHVQAGTLALRSFDHLHALQPDGRWVLFTDGDCRKIDSNALVPVSAPYVPANANNRLPHLGTSGFGGYPAISGRRLYF